MATIVVIMRIPITAVAFAGDGVQVLSCGAGCFGAVIAFVVVIIAREANIITRASTGAVSVQGLSWRAGFSFRAPIASIIVIITNRAYAFAGV